MTNLNIVPNFEKKTAKFEGTVAAGEKIHVTISDIGGYIGGVENLRLRAVGSDGGTLAQFPPLEEDGITWSKEGNTLECELNLNTVQMLETVPPAARVMVLFVLDNPENETLYFKSFFAVDHWPRRVGEEEPVDLGGYADFVNDAKQSIASAEAAIKKAEANAKAAQEAATGSVGSAATYASEAKEYAESAADTLANAATKAELQAEVVRAKSAEGILRQDLVAHAVDDEAHFVEGEKGALTSAINENKSAIQENNKTLTAAINKVASDIENIDLSDYRKKKDHVFFASNEPLIVAAKGIEEYESVVDIPLEKSLMIDIVSYWDEDENEERSVASFYAPHTDFFTDDIGLNSAFWLSANQWSEGGEIEFRAAPQIPMRFWTEGASDGFIFEHVKEEWDEELEEQIYKYSHMSFNCNAFEAEADNIFFIGHDYDLDGWGGATTISNDQLYLQAQYEVYDEESGEGEYKLGISMEGGQLNFNAYGGSVYTSADYITTSSPMIENYTEWFSASCFDAYQPEHFDMALSNGGSWIDGGCMGLELASYYSRDEYLGSKISLLPDGIYMQSENYLPESDYYAGYISLATPSLEIATCFYIKNGRDVIGTDGIRIGTDFNFNPEENKFTSATLEAHYDWENETSNVSMRGNGEVETYIVVNDYGCIDIRGASIEVSSPDGEESVILTCSDLIKLKALIS